MREILVLASLGRVITLGGCKADGKAGDSYNPMDDEVECAEGLVCSEYSNRCMDRDTERFELSCKDGHGCIGRTVSIPHDGSGHPGSKATEEKFVCLYAGETDEDCEERCKSAGECAAKDGACVAVTEAHCAQARTGHNCESGPHPSGVNRVRGTLCTPIDGVCVGYLHPQDSGTPVTRGLRR